MKKRRTSLKDLAEQLGVSIATVSRALRDSCEVGDEMKQKVRELAKQMNYRPNPFAQGLRSEAPKVIGVVLPNLVTHFNASVLDGIEDYATREGYSVISANSHEDHTREEQAVDNFVSMHVEGIIACLAQDTVNYKHFAEISEIGIPLVFYARTCMQDHFSCVTGNGDVAAQEATQHLIDTGSRRIAFLGGPNHLDMVQRRKHGYLEALRERGLSIKKELVKCGKVSFNAGLSDTLELLNLPEPPDAILADHGMLSISAFQAIVSKGICVPDELAFVGFMSDWVSGMTYPRLTFVKQNLKEIGCQVFKLLYEQMSGDKTVRHIVVNARLNIRESTRNKS